MRQTVASLVLTVVAIAAQGSSSQPVVGASGPGRILVRVKPGVDVSALAQLAGARVERQVPQIRLAVLEATAPERVLSLLRPSPFLERAELDTSVWALDTNPNDVAWPDQTGARRAGFARAWDVTRGSPRTLVGVLDTGVDPAHPDLHGAVVQGIDLVDGGFDASDDDGHGTAVAGILAARANNRIGIAGGCWSCSVLAVKVLRADRTGRVSDLVSGIVWAVDHGARVLNLSLGAPGRSGTLADAVAYAVAHDVVVVAAAGNYGTDTPVYPAAEDGVIAVGASDDSDHLYRWSNRGAWVDVAAPGCNVTLWLRSGYASFCGTSSASPLVAGLAALIRSRRPAASASEVTQWILRTAGSRPEALVHGRIDASRALRGPLAGRDRRRPILRWWATKNSDPARN
jgi:subtilisin family serine protease